MALIPLLSQGLLQSRPLLQTSLLLGILFRISFLKTLQKNLYILQVLLQFLYIICLIISLLFYQVFLLTCYSNSLVLNIFNFIFNYLVFFYQFQGDSQYVLGYRFQQRDIEYRVYSYIFQQFKSIIIFSNNSFDFKQSNLFLVKFL